ncbi:MAG: glycosyl hydrolase-related protein [Bacteroidetes bacterium]|nr:glycosyl hydrolase-related protein [Bacteroidota bacterium]
MRRSVLQIILWALCLICTKSTVAQFDRDWKIFVVPFSHTDVGFTAPVPDVIEQHRKYLDDVVTYINQTQSYPAESQFKWTIEVTWVLEDYLKNRSREEVAALMNHVRAGQIEIAAMHFSLQTDLAGPEELVRSLYFAQALKEEYNVPIQTAVTNDTPGFTWALAQLLAKSNIPYASLAMNSFLSEFYSTTTLPNLFYWESQSGDQTLLWRSLHPEWAYLEGIIWGLYGPYTAMEPRITAQLNKLAADGYPYDVVLVNASTGDNRPPNPKISDNAHIWNENHDTSTIHVATFSDFFDYVEQNLANELPVFKGDAPNWWSWSFAASSTKGFLESRSTQTILPVAETFASIANSVAPSYIYPADELRQAYINNLLFEDHNLGSLDPAGNAPFWGRKMAWINAARNAGETILDEALEAWSSTIATDNDVTVVVFNPLPWERSEVVRLPLDDPLVASLPAFHVLDGETGSVRPSQILLSTDEIAFQADGVPPLGYKLFHLRTHTGTRPPPRTLNSATLENDAYRVEVNLATGGISNIQEKKTGQELTRGDARFNQYTYNGTAPSGFQVVASDSGTVLQRLVLQGMAPGANTYETEIMLPAGQRRIDFRNKYNKRPVASFEGVDFLFRFDLPGASLRYEIPFGHVRVFEDELSGFRTNHYAMQRWAIVSGGNTSAILATDGPAIHAYPAGRFDGNVRLLTSFNTSGTAYRAGVGPLEAGFSLTSHEGTADPVSATKFAYNFNTPLYTRVLPPQQKGTMSAPSYTFMSVKNATLQLSTLKRPRTGDGFIVRLYNPSSEAVESTLSFGPEIRRAAWTTLLEAPIGYMNIVDREITVPFKPHEVRTIWLDLIGATRAQTPDPFTEILQLEPNFPNPFGHHTTIRYNLHRHAQVRLTIYDVLGRTVSELEATDKSPGQYAHSWTGVNQQGLPLASGVYFYTVEATTSDNVYGRQNRTMILIR